MPSRLVVDSEDTPDPWYLTVIRTQGLLFVRPEKSWRPVVCFDVVDRPQPLEVALGCDGQNPNTKVPLKLHHVSRRSKLDIKVLHKSHKHRKRQHIVGSAFVSLGELVSKQVRPGSTIDIRLSCPTPQKKSPTVKNKQQHHASLIIRLHAPDTTPVFHSEEELYHSDSDAEILSELSSSKDPSETAVDEPTPEQDDPPPNTLRRRKPRIRGYSLDTDDENEDEDEDEDEDDEAASIESSYPSTPRDDYFPPIPDLDKPALDPTILGSADTDRDGTHSAREPDLLPRYTESVERLPLSWGERVLDRVAPYAELREAERVLSEHARTERFDKVLARLLTEWYVVAASLLALAGIDAAIFGLAPGSIFPVDGLARMVVALGAISAGLGLFLDTLLVFSYSNADATKFQTIAKDVYGTYIFFCLYCRIPAVCLLVSATCLTLFLLTVAWAEWPSAVLVVSFLAGILFSLQYLVFGCHRIFNFAMWCVRYVWRALCGRAAQSAQARKDGHAPSVMGQQGSMESSVHS